jgi:hypothetical protein
MVRFQLLEVLGEAFHLQTFLVVSWPIIAWIFPMTFSGEKLAPRAAPRTKMQIRGLGLEIWGRETWVSISTIILPQLPSGYLT